MLSSVPGSRGSGRAGRGVRGSSRPGVAARASGRDAILRRVQLAVLVLLSAAVGALGPVSPGSAAEPTPLEVFQKFFRERDPVLRRKAVAQLSGCRGAGVVEALLQAAKDEDPAVRDRAADVLLERRDRPEEIETLAKTGLGKQPAEVRLLAAKALCGTGPAASAPLRAALGDRDPAIRCVAARGLAAAGDREAAPLLHELLLAKDATVRAVACEAIGDLLGERAVGTATTVALGDSAAEPRIAAVAILGRHPAPDSVAHVVRGLSDPAWQLRVAASKSLREFGFAPEPAREAATALVASLRRESRRRVQEEMAEALWTLTGIDFGPDAKRWAAWHAEAGARFTPPPRRPVRSASGAGASRGHLLDLPIESEHVCFVLDTSGSMADPVRFGSETTKLVELRAAFEAVVGRLPKPAWMNLIPFSTAPRPYKAELFEATPGARAAVVRHLDKIPAEGRTNVYDSLVAALSDRETDTVVLVTDGAPSVGSRTTRAGILEGLREMNRWRFVRVHTVEVGAANTGARWRGFLREVADATGGHHLQR